MQRLLNVQEYAELFALTAQAVRARIRKGTLTAQKINGVWCIPDDVVLDHIKNIDRIRNRNRHV